MGTARFSPGIGQGLRRPRAMAADAGMHHAAANRAKYVQVVCAIRGCSNSRSVRWCSLYNDAKITGCCEKAPGDIPFHRAPARTAPNFLASRAGQKTRQIEDWRHLQRTSESVVVHPSVYVDQCSSSCHTTSSDLERRRRHSQAIELLITCSQPLRSRPAKHGGPSSD